jgi:hypothetical protein
MAKQGRVHKLSLQTNHPRTIDGWNYRRAKVGEMPFLFVGGGIRSKGGAHESENMLEESLHGA